MNKIIKNYIEEADYNEVMDIMECANNRMSAIIAEKENPWEWIFSIVQLAADYRNKLHLEAAPHEQYHCNCYDYHT